MNLIIETNWGVCILKILFCTNLRYVNDTWQLKHSKENLSFMHGFNWKQKKTWTGNYACEWMCAVKDPLVKLYLYGITGENKEELWPWRQERVTAMLASIIIMMLGTHEQIVRKLKNAKFSRLCNLSLNKKV